MSTLREDLALERLALTAWEQEAAAAWRMGHYLRSHEARKEAAAARERIAQLEAA